MLARILVPLSGPLLFTVSLVSPAIGQQAQISDKRVVALSADQREFLSHVTMVDLPDGQGGVVRTARISGINVQIVNDTGSTSTQNGLGNLVVG